MCLRDRGIISCHSMISCISYVFMLVMYIILRSMYTCAPSECLMCVDEIMGSLRIGCVQV